jgi:hypothetical protein
MLKNPVATLVPFLGLTLIGSLTPLSASAAILSGNLPQTNDNSITSLAQGFRKTVSFTLPSGSNQSLDNVIVRLGSYSDASTAPIVEIRADAGGLDPGSTVLATLTTPASQGSGIFNYTFTPSSPFTFTAGTKYWLYAYSLSTTTNSPAWQASVPAITPTGIATFNNFRFSNNTGSTWTNSATFNSFQINVTEVPPIVPSVPEPASVLGLMVIGTGLLASRQKK